MNIKTFKKVLIHMLEAGITPWVWGQHAKGKSESIEDFYRERNWWLFNIRLNTQSDVGDVLGLQEFVTDPKTGKKVATAFMKPEWLEDAIQFCLANPTKRACVFFDEVNRASSADLVGPLFQMALDHRLHTTVFPKNLDVILASNPNTKNYSGLLDLDDEALLSRFWHVDFNPTRQEWFDYTVVKEYDPDIPGFIEQHPDFLEMPLEKFSISDFAKPDRRKWGMVNKLHKNRVLDKDEQTEVFSGLVGLTIALAFESYLEKLEKPLTVEEILDQYPNVRDRILKAKTGARVRTDIINNTAIKVKDFFKDDPALTEVQGVNVVNFIRDLPEDQMFGVMHAIYKKRKFHDFCEKHYEKLNMLELQQRLDVIRKNVLPETLK